MPGWTPPPPTEGLAAASLAVSLGGLVLALMCGVTILACPAGAVMGHVALRRIARSGAQGRGLALAGVIIGWIGTALLVAGALLIGLLVAASA